MCQPERKCPSPGLRAQSPWQSRVRVSWQSRWTAHSSEGRGAQLWLSGVFYFCKHIAAAALKFAAFPPPPFRVLGGVALLHAAIQVLDSRVEGAPGAAVCGGRLPAGDPGSRGLCEWEGALRLSLLGALRLGRSPRSRLVPHPVFLPCHLVSGPVQGFRCQGAGCGAVRQMGC